MKKQLTALLTVGVVAVVYLFSPVILAETSQSSSDQLKTLLNPITTLQGGFQQTVKSERGKVLQRLSGKVWLKKPAQFRWEILGKDSRLVIADGKKVWDFDKDLDQVTVQKLDKGQTRAPIYFLTGDANSIDKDFHVTSIGSQKSERSEKSENAEKQNSPGKCLQESNACFELKPKQKEGAFQWVRIGFKDKILREMEMLDQLGQYSHFVFKDVILNGNISTNQFQFTPPAGVDVLKND
jgi:outer membrane lipoprotein carrier protein